MRGTPQFIGLKTSGKSDFGSDLVIAVIDTDITPNHKSFNDQDLGSIPTHRQPFYWNPSLSPSEPSHLLRNQTQATQSEPTHQTTEKKKKEKRSIARERSTLKWSSTSAWKSSEGERTKAERLRERRGLGFEKIRVEETDGEMNKKNNKSYAIICPYCAKLLGY